MKKYILYTLLSLITLTGCKEDTELSDIMPFQFSPTSVEINPQSVTLKTDVKSDRPIEEKGFIVEQTITMNIYDSRKYIDTIHLAPNEPFECTLVADLDASRPCIAHAYIKQNGAYYQNESVTFTPIGSTPPVITSITSGYNNQYGKYIHIIGENFSKIKEYNVLKCYDDTNDWNFAHDCKLLKWSPTELLFSHDIRKTGDVQIVIQINKLQASAPHKLYGPTVKSWSPLKPRYGEPLTIQLSDITKDMVLGAYGMKGFPSDLESYVQIEGESLTFPYLNNQQDNYFNITIQYPSYRIKVDYIVPSIPWEKRDDVSASLDEESSANAREKLNGTITPSCSLVAGEYDGYVYYIAGNGDIYRIKAGTTGEGEHVATLSPDWKTYICSAQIIGSNLYYATRYTGIIKYDLITGDKEYLGCPPTETTYYQYQKYHFFEKENELYIIDLQRDSLIYQYVEDRND